MEEKKMKILQLIDKINNGDIDEVLKLFGDSETLINIINKYGLLHLVDPNEIDDYRNEITYLILNGENEKAKNNLYTEIIDRLADVETIDGKYYLNISDLSDLSELFKSYSRETSPRDVAEKILSEDYWEPFWDTTDNVYRDVIESLTPDNLKYLKQLVLKKLNGKEIELDGRSSDLMDELVTNQNKEGSFNVTEENIDEILNDEDTTLWLLENELDDIKSELYNLHSNAYNSAYNDEYYKKVWDELYEYFEGNPDWFKFGNRDRVRIKIKEGVLENIIKTFFYEYRKYNDDFDNYGSFMSLLTHLMDNVNDYEFLSFRMLDYPDFSDVENNINTYFGDYL